MTAYDPHRYADSDRINSIHDALQHALALEVEAFDWIQCNHCETMTPTRFLNYQHATKIRRERFLRTMAAICEAVKRMEGEREAREGEETARGEGDLTHNDYELSPHDTARDPERTAREGKGATSVPRGVATSGPPPSPGCLTGEQLADAAEKMAEFSENSRSLLEQMLEDIKAIEVGDAGPKRFAALRDNYVATLTSYLQQSKNFVTFYESVNQVLRKLK